MVTQVYFRILTIHSSLTSAQQDPSTRSETTPTEARATKKGTKRWVSTMRSCLRAKLQWKLFQRSNIISQIVSKYCRCPSSSITEKTSFNVPNSEDFYLLIIRKLSGSVLLNVLIVWIRRLSVNSTRSIPLKSRFHRNGFSSNITNKIQTCNRLWELIRVRLRRRSRKRDQKWGI